MAVKEKRVKLTSDDGKVEWVPIAAVGLGIAAVGLGLYFYTKKPPGVSPGDVVRAHFKFDYLGEGGDYVLLVRFGYHHPETWLPPLPEWFDPEEGLDDYMLEITLPEPGTYEFDIDCTIPDGTPARTYDAEGSIGTIEMVGILRVFKDKAITVRKE